MTRRDTCEHCPRERCFPLDGLPGGDHRERPGGGNAETVHGLPDDVLAQHRAERGLAVTTTCERRPSRALQMEIPAATLDVDDLAEEQCASVPEPRVEVPELVTGVHLSNRFGTGWGGMTDE